MSRSRIKLCSLIFKEYYGEITEKIGTYLLERGASPLVLLIKDLKLPRDQVKKGIAMMIKQNIVIFNKTKKGFFEYSVNTDNVLIRLRFPRYIYCGKLLYGDAAELIIEDVLHQGQALMSSVIEKVTIKLNEALESSGGPAIGEDIAKDKFSSLVRTHFLQRCPEMIKDEDDKVVSMGKKKNDDDDDKRYALPPQDDRGSKKRKWSADDSSQPAKKIKTESGKEAPADDGIYWMVNFDRFHQHFRDLSFVDAVESKTTKHGAEIVRAILRVSEVKTNPWAAVTTPISLSEIIQVLPKELGLTKQMVEQYLSVLADDTTNFVSKVGDSGGGMYVINVHKGLTTLTKAHIESVIQERYGSKSLRIFRVLLMKKHLEQKQIEEFAMIPAKEAKDLLYTLFSAGYVGHTELSKTPDHAPSRTFYLFKVDVSAVTRMLLEKTYKAVANVILRRGHELRENKRLLDKQQRVEAIAASLEQSGADQEQKDEIEQLISPPERVHITKVKTTINKLDQSEIQVDDTIFILQMYLHYETLQSLNRL